MKLMNISLLSIVLSVLLLSLSAESAKVPIPSDFDAAESTENEFNRLAAEADKQNWETRIKAAMAREGYDENEFKIEIGEGNNHYLVSEDFICKFDRGRNEIRGMLYSPLTDNPDEDTFNCLEREASQ